MSLQAVPPKLSLSSEGLSAYMASLQEKRRQLEERQKQAESKKQVGLAVLVGCMAGLAACAAPSNGLHQSTWASTWEAACWYGWMHSYVLVSACAGGGAG